MNDINSKREFMKLSSQNLGMNRRDNSFKNFTLDEYALSKEETIKHNLYKSLEQTLKTRKSIRPDSCEIIKLTYCCCCKMNNKEKITNSVMDYIEESSEIGNIIKKTRELELLKKLLLVKDQRKMFILPSKNIKVEKDEEADDPIDFIDILYEANDVIKSNDLKDRKNRVLGKNIITSII